jgi:hypothetical protein
MFQREVMRCFKCGFTQKADPKIESGWFKVVAGKESVHICPKCAGAPDPQCHQCQRFYHEDYLSCPWCDRS